MSGDERDTAFFAGEDGVKEQDADGALRADGNGFALVDWFGEAGGDSGKGEEEGRSFEALKEAFAESRKEDAARQNQALKASMAQAADAEPEEEAKIRALARRFDAPPEMARHYREQFEAQARNERMEAISSAYPKTAEFLSEPDHARLAHDDVDNMTALEAMFAQPEGFSIAGDFGARADKARIAPLDFAVDAVRNLAAGAVGGAIKTAGSTASFLARSLPVPGTDPESALYDPLPLTGDEQAARYKEAEKVGKALAAASGADALYRFGKKTEEAIAGEGMGEYGLVGRSLLSGFRSLGNMLPAAAASFAAGGPALSLAFAGLSEGGEAFMDDVLAGKRLGQATLHGMANGGIEAATEFLPMSRLIKEAAAGTPFVSLFLRNWARETPSELVATAGQTLSDRIAGMKEGEDAGDVFLKWLEELPENELETAISVIPMSLGFSGAARVQQIGAARSLKKTVERFNRLAGESRLRSRSPEDYAAMAGFLASGSGVTHAYIDAQKWIGYFQEKGVDPKEAAEQYGALNYGEAAELGVSLMIPFGRYQAGFSGSEHAAAFTADTKFDERALTAEEGEAQQAKSAPNTALLAGMLHELGEESKTAGALGKAVEQLTDEVAGQLTLRFGGEDARTQASILARAFVHPFFRDLMARAEEAGKKVSPEEVVADIRRYFEGYGLVVEANAHAAEAAQQYGQPAQYENLHPVARKYLELAQADQGEIFRYKTSDKQDLKEILDEFNLGFDVSSLHRPGIKAAKAGAIGMWDVLAPDGSWAWVYIYPERKLAIDASRLRSKESRGSALIQAVANLAYNMGYRFEGDRTGLTPTGRARAAEHMLSSALRYGTTRHLAPAQNLLTPGENGEPALKWREGDDLWNITQLIEITYKNVRDVIPEIERFRYNFEKNQFEENDGKNWRAVPGNHPVQNSRRDGRALQMDAGGHQHFADRPGDIGRNHEEAARETRETAEGIAAALQERIESLVAGRAGKTDTDYPGRRPEQPHSAKRMEPQDIGRATIARAVLVLSLRERVVSETQGRHELLADTSIVGHSQQRDQTAGWLLQVAGTPLSGLLYQAGKRTYGQPLNAGVSLDTRVPVVAVTPQFQGQDPKIVRKRFPVAIRKNVLSAFKEGVTNVQTGITVSMSGNDFTEHLHFKDDATGDAHLEAIAVLPELMQSASLVESHPGKKAGDEKNLKQIHRFISALRVGNKDYSVMLTVKEFKDGVAALDIENPVRLYHHRVEKSLPSVTSASFPIEQAGSWTTPGTTEYTIRDLLSGVKDAWGQPYFESTQGGGWQQYWQPVPQGFHWEYGQREGLFDLPAVPITRISGSEFGEGREAIQAGAMAHLNKVRSGTPIRNRDTRWALQISRNDWSKIVKDPEQTLEALQAVFAIEQLAENAVLAESHRDREHNNPDVQGIHRMYAPLEINGVLYRAKLTVRDYTGVKSGEKTRLHDIDTIEIEKPGDAITLTNPSETAKTGTPTGLSSSISEVQSEESANRHAIDTVETERRPDVGPLSSASIDDNTGKITLPSERTLSMSEILAGSSRHDGTPWDTSKAEETRQGEEHDREDTRTEPEASQAETHERRGFTEAANPGAAEQAEANRQYDEVVAQYRGTDQWMKAPNGKPTNLSERQWVQARTANFKRWLGFDWERESEAQGFLRLWGDELLPQGTGAQSGLADTGLSPAMRQVAHLVQEARAALSERDYGRAQQLRERAGRALGRLAQLDPATGEPQIYYHGSKADIHAFDPNHPNKKDNGWLGKGIYLTNDAFYAGEYARLKKGDIGENIMPLFARLKNPYIASMEEKAVLGIRTEEQSKERTAELIRQGYDGIIVYEFRQQDWIETKEVVVFAPEQVKSAIGNAGTFSESPPVLYQRQGPVPVSEAGDSQIGIEEVRQLAEELAAAYRNAPELVVVEKPADLPFDAPEDAKGAYRLGKCYLVSVNIHTAEDAKGTFAHEVIGHYGLNGFFGDRLSLELDNILFHNRNVREAAQKWVKDNADYIRAVRESRKDWSHERFDQWRRNIATEEALAQMAGRGEKVTGARKLVYAIQKLLRTIGLEQLAESLEAQTDAEALIALHKAELFVRSGRNVDTATVADVYARFLRDGKAGSRIGIEEVRQTAKELAAEYGNAPELVVVEKPSDLPFDAPEDAKGVYWRGRCFLVQRNITSAGDARNTFAHEVIGHYGLRGFFGERLSRELNQILIHNKNVQEAAQQWIEKNPDYIREVRQKNPHWSHERFMQWRKEIATEEALAQMAERGEKVTGARKLVYAIQKLLRTIGLEQLAESLEAQTDAEALMALHKAELFVRSGRNVDTATATDVYALFARHDRKAIYQRQVDELASGERNVASLGMPSKALLDSGIANVRLQITRDVVDKVEEKHGISLAQLKALPDLLEHPVMVFKSATDGGHVVVTSDFALSNHGERMPLVVAIRPNGEVSINYIRSVYARSNFGQKAIRWMEAGLLVSAQKKAAVDLIDLYSQRGKTSGAVRIINNGRVKSLPESALSRKQGDDFIDFFQEDDGQAGSFWPEGEDALDEDARILQQFIGEKGAAELDRAEEATVRLDNLAVAREMEVAGRQAKVIKLATGWERGADGKWRYEISDAFLRLNLPEKGGKRLGEVLIHPELFMAYPDLKGLSVVREPILSPAGAAAFLDGDTIFVDRDLLPRETASALLHEVQHAIQEREGFARGAAPDAFETDEKGLVDTGRDRRRYVKPDMAYKAVAGEVEARNAQRRAFMTPEQRMYLLASETEDVARKDQIILHQALLPDGLTAEGTRQGEAEAYEKRGYTASANPGAAEQVEANRQYDEIVAQYKGGPLWLKAPNGEPTRLTERQWVQARTANFKEEFGDWEKAAIRQQLAAQTPVEVEAKFTEETANISKNEAAKLLPKPITVETVIGEVLISRNGIRESVHHSRNVAKLDVIPYLKVILEQATYLDRLQDFTGKDIQNHYFATRIAHGGQTKLVFLRVRESVNTRQLYVHDVFIEDEIKKASSLQTSPLSQKDFAKIRGTGLYRAILQEIYSTVNLSISKDVDKNGEPAASWWQEREAYGRRGYTASPNPSEAEQVEANRQYDEIVAQYKGGPLWLKAPNGEPTRLTERQWVQARTENFKAVFGDWEKAGIRERLEAQTPVEVEAKYEATSPRERRELVKGLHIDFIADTHIGPVIVNNSSIKSSLQHGNTNRKLDVLDRLKEILEISTFLDVTEDFDGKGHKNYYLATRIHCGNSSEIVFFRVRKTAGRDQKLYVHAIFTENEIKNQSPVSALDKSRQGAEGQQSNGHPRGPDLYKSILQEIYNTVNLSISKAVDKNGEPAASWWQEGEAYGRRGYTASPNPSEAEQVRANRQYDEIVAKYKGGPLWLKAPNGEPTKLTERQWVQARTANFKEEFGDWEKAAIRQQLAAQTPVEVADDYKISSHKERKAKAVELLDAEISVQKNVGLVKVSKSGIRKSFAHSTSDAKLDVIPKIREILEQATYLDTLQDFTGKEIQNHYFATRIAHGGQTKLVFLRVRKMPGTENQLYVHDVFVEEEIKAKAGNPLQIRAYGEEAVRNLRGTSLYEGILQEIYSTVNLSISNAVDKNGEPAASWWQEGEEAGKGQFLSEALRHEQKVFTESERPTAEEKLKQDVQEWGKRVDLVESRKRKPSAPVLMLRQTPLVMHLLGADFREVYAAPHLFDGLLPEERPGSTHNVHPNMTAEILRQLPAALADPVAVFRSATREGRFVFMLDVRDANGATVVVPIELNAKKDLTAVAHIATSAYSKESNGLPNNAWFAKQAKENALYINRQKEKRWTETSSGSNSLWVKSSAFRDNKLSSEKRILTEEDLVKLKQKYPSYYQYEQQGKTRGAFVISPERQMRIDLFKDADYSTFVHETAHFMLEVYRDLANAPGASAYIRKEYAAILRYLDAKPGQPITRRQHEKFARAFERYLMEGKAPSAAMRGVFSRFKDWLLDIYRYFIRLDVALSDDIRAVFDRMLATDGEIAFMRQAREMEPLFASARAMGADDAAFAAYEEKSRLEWQAAADALRACAMRQRLHEGTRAYRKAYERMRQRAADAYDAQPAAKALYALTSHEGFALNAAKLRQVYGEDFISLLPVVAGRRIYGEQGDLLLEDAAGALGFDSGDAMIRAIARLPEREAFVREEARRRMLEEEARDLRGETLAASLEGALGNAHRLERLKAELGFLARLDQSGQALPEGAIPAQFAAMQQEAAAVVAGRLVGHLKPSLYFQAMQAAARKAREAVDRPRPNYGEAIRQKRAELMNLLLFREASRVLLAVEDGVAQAQAVAARPFEEAVRTRDAFCVARAKWLATRLHLGGDADALLADIRAMEAGRQAGGEAFLGDAAAGPVEEMTAAAALDALGAVQAFWKLARRLQVMAVEGRRVALSRAAGAVAARLRQAGRSGKVRLPAVSAADGVMAALGSLRWQEARMAVFCRLADNLMAGEVAGPLARYVFEPLKKAADKARRVQEEALGRLDEVLAGFGFVRETIAAPELGMTFGKATGYGKAELVHALLYAGSVSGLQGLVAGHGWGGFIEGRLDTRRWEAFLSRMAAEGRLTREDYDRVQAVWDVFAGLVPRWQQAHEALFGRAFEGAAARPFVAFGKAYRGGFVPVPDMVGGSAGGQGAPLALDLSALRSQLGEMVMFTWAAPVGRDVSRLLEQKAVQAAFGQVAPGWLDEVVKPWLACCMQPYAAYAGEGLTVLDGWAGIGRLRAGAAALLDTGAEALMQQGMGAAVFARVKPFYVAAAFQQMAKDRTKTARAVSAASPYMRGRLRENWAAFSEGLRSDGAVSDAGLPALAADMFCAPVIWAAAYHQALAEEGLAHAAAVSLADREVRQALGADGARHGVVWQDGGAFALFQAYFAGQAQGSGMAGRQAAAAALLLQMAMLPVWSGSALCRMCGDAVEGKAFDRWLKDAFGWGAMDGEGFSLAGRAVPLAGEGRQLAALAAFGRVFYPPFAGLTDAACRAMAWVGPDGAFDSARFAQDMAAFWETACGLPDVVDGTADDGAFADEAGEAGKPQIFYQQGQDENDQQRGLTSPIRLTGNHVGIIGYLEQSVADCLPGKHAGDIYVSQGTLDAIDGKHEKQFKQLGLKNAAEFIRHTLEHVTAVYDAGGGAFDFVNMPPSPNYTVIAEARFNQDDGRYEITSAYPRRATSYKKRTPLWERAPSSHSKGTPRAISGQSGVSCLNIADGKGKDKPINAVWRRFTVVFTC